MEMVFNFILLAVSGTASFYCLALNRKLDNLKNTEKGLGATIASMSQIVEEARIAVVLAKESSEVSISQLSPLVKDSQILIPKLNELTDVVSELSELSINDINNAAAKAQNELSHKIALSKRLSAKLRRELEQLEMRRRTLGKIAKQTAQPKMTEEIVTYIDDIGAEEPSLTKESLAIEKSRSVRERNIVAG